MHDIRVLKFKLKDILQKAQNLDYLSEEETTMYLAKEPTDEELREIEAEYSRAT